MQLTPEQEALVRAWAAEGATLSDIQTRLADECGVRLSYLDTRFLLLDLKVDLVEKTKKEPPPRNLESGAPAAGFGSPDGGAGERSEPEGVDPDDDAYGAAPPLPGEEYGEPADAADAPGGPGAEPPAPADAGAGEASTLTVDLARIQRPGFAASGSVTCSDGVKGEWGIDAYGRLALAFPDNKGYRPSAADQQAFMQRLRSLLSGGY